MAEAGFFAQKRGSPTGLVLVVLAHAAVLGAVAMIKGPAVFTDLITKTTVDTIKIEPDPPPEPPKQREEARQESPRETYTAPETAFDPPDRGPATETLPPLPPRPDPPGNTVTRDPPADPPVTPPVRREAEYDSRYADALQPPYPPAEERAQRDGEARIRVTIGTNGRVTAVTRLAATSEAFWRATERHALARWRFKPATVDGRPVQSSKVLNVRFRIPDL